MGILSTTWDVGHLPSLPSLWVINLREWLIFELVSLLSRMEKKVYKKKMSMWNSLASLLFPRLWREWKENAHKNGCVESAFDKTR